MTESRNPYIYSDKSPKLQRSVVCFVDILGYKDLVKSTSNGEAIQDLLDRLHNALRLSHENVDPRRSDDTLLKLQDKDFYAFSSFTDNIVIGHPIHCDGEIELGRIFNDLSYFQMFMTKEGFFVRGAIAIGDLYMDDITVFGSGLIEAYEAETNLAINPRIMLATSAKEAVNRLFEHSGHGSLNRYLLRDCDEQYYLNYLDSLVAENGRFYESELTAHKTRIEENLVLRKSHPRVWAKYFWAAIYHNYFCDKHSCVDSSMKIDTERFHTMPAMLVQDL